ncbi:single-stranded DNA-binding protein 3 isoform X1 [Myotis myotis]|uniref:single-stranded DNA-binding protein 3 isoform X1 n=1 Tax=Myotis myotis TaxID=51298 RepID=UPI00174A1565|nr:single-stranded DNA-binding protein 3 isoform X1 [Myotis myotis]
MPGWVTLVQDAKRAAQPPKVMNAVLLYFLYRIYFPNLFSDSLLHRSALNIRVFTRWSFSYLSSSSVTICSFCHKNTVTSAACKRPPLFGLAPSTCLELARGRSVAAAEDALESGAGRDPLCSASAAAAPSPVLGNIPPNDGMPGGPIPPGFFQGPPGSQPSPHAQPPPHNPSSMMGPHSQPFMSPRYAGGPRPPIRMGNQPPGGVPGTQPLLPNSMDPTRQQGHPNMGGSMQRMNPPRGMGPMGPGPQNYGSGMRPPPNSLGPAMPGINMGPGAGRPWPNPNSANSIPYSSSSPGTYVGPPGGGGPPGTPIMPSPADSTNSSDNIYTMINPVPPGGSRSNFPMGPGSDGPMGGMGGMEPHHMNGSLGSGDIDGLPKNSPNNISGISNPPGTPRDDGELGGNFLHSFQNDNYSPSMTMSV